MIKKYRIKNSKFMIILLILFVLTGCSRNPERPNPETQDSNSPKLPKILTELDDEVLKIMYDLDSVTGLEKAIQKQELIESENENASISTAAQSDESNQKSKEEESAPAEEDKKIAYLSINNTESRLISIDKEIDLLREKLGQYRDEKESLEEQKQVLYSLLHSIIGPEEIEKLDIRFLQKK